MQIIESKPNQTLIAVGDREVFFSYKTPVAGFIPGIGLVRTDHKHSTTTSRHINQYLAGRTATVKPQAYLDTLAD